MNVVERRYTGTCDVYEKQKSTNEATNVTSLDWVPVALKIPCRLVVESAPATVPLSGASEATQLITVLLSGDVLIKPGCRMIITQDGRTASYHAAGLPVIYPSHQEVTLMFEEWS